MSAPEKKRPLRLMYAAGPGDIVGTFRHWRAGHDDPGQVAMTYSGQFYDVCRELGAQGYAIGSHPRRETVRDGDFCIEHRRIRFTKGPAVLYHLGQLLSALRMIASAIRFRADALVICDGTCHWFALRLLPWLGVRVIPTLHCMFWPQSSPPPGQIKRLLNRLDLPFWHRSATAILSASSDINCQLDQLTANLHAPVIDFLPTYRPGTFDAAPPALDRKPFRVLFGGRIEAYKGVFDLLEVARQLNQACRDEIEFDLCGAGSAIEQLKRKAAELALSDRFRIHGHCDRPTMRQMFHQAHVLIVPTTTDFAEGFNQVVVEGVLAARPVITSSVCPALDYVRKAVVEVPPDDVDSYRQAILRLLDDRDFYEQKRNACLALQSQFYDATRGWAAALLRTLAI
jgi:glycosyltransferase involved in cell wall biosynthesis